MSKTQVQILLFLSASALYDPLFYQYHDGIICNEKECGSINIRTFKKSDRGFFMKICSGNSEDFGRGE